MDRLAVTVEMAGATDLSGVTVISAAEIKELITEVLLLAGASEHEAAAQAQVLLEGDLRDQHSHGLQRLRVLVGRIRNGVLICGRQPAFNWIADSVLTVDGGGGFGPVVAMAAIEELIPRADRTGIALGLINQANHLGMLAPYVEKIAGQGQIGIATTISEALVSPYGGASAMLGTNPLAIAVPTDGDPLTLDMSTAAVSMGKIIDYAGRLQPLPTGWAIDSDGHPTTDPSAALDGAISPFGGPKGYALGLALEAMVAALTGSALGRNVRGTLDDHAWSSKGDVLICISLQALGRTEEPARIGRYLQDVRDSPAVDSDRPVSVPGDRARSIRDIRLSEGVPLSSRTWADAVELRKEARADERSSR